MGHKSARREGRRAGDGGRKARTKQRVDDTGREKRKEKLCRKEEKEGNGRKESR